MTNKEAINILKDMIDYQWGFSDMEKSIGIDALKKGIEALENQKSIIKELEQIKQEMTPDSDNFYQVSNARPFIKIIDKHISELKGENNNG